MKTKKSTLYTIVVLLVIFLPISLYGLIQNNNLKKEKENENPNHEFLYEGSLYFYSDTGELIGKYKCITEECGYGKPLIDDSEYNIDYYMGGEKTELNIDSNDYAFIQDGSATILYSKPISESVVMFESVKNYNTDLATNILIAKLNGKWGVLSLDSFTPVLDYKYDFIGLPNHVDEGILQTDNFVVLSEEKWNILDKDFNELTPGLDNPIKSFNEKYIITNDNKIYDYEGTEVGSNLEYKDAYAFKDYVILINESNVVLVYNDLTASSIGMGNINSYEKISFALDEGNVLNVYTDESMGTTIDLP